MGNPCGTTKANIYEQTEIRGIPVYFGAGVNPVNSPAQFFVAWGIKALAGGLIHTFNISSLEEGTIWFVDEDEAEAEFKKIQKTLASR
ncbi:hypothetical protein Desor_0810 [Desulfosporosinus orientis DSM 765]|uniref:Uncharacterized protein n=1 Tax=Desulfosporosinus orientis (strain ATCC 19365 / DSM 765 / NCIMB 8382 / VKM B-1628 / Singapore I) TaxID=768706 RepID=G7WAE3_DESOD|nr:hypothetical protein [Desulfosporosinus orientis]AET66492.1 hypothetical protein Desor_0810 [Desulfosporosinus orientis DSM 765]